MFDEVSPLLQVSCLLYCPQCPPFTLRLRCLERIRWVQRVYLCLWRHRLWENFHNVRRLLGFSVQNPGFFGVVALLHHCREGYPDVQSSASIEEKDEEPALSPRQGTYSRKAKPWEGIIPRTFDLLFNGIEQLYESHGWE